MHLHTSSSQSLAEAWQDTVKKLLDYGRIVSPRDQKTYELPQHTIVFDMNYPVLNIKERKLHVPFLGGEAYWILSGDDTVAGIKDYNRHIVQFSDDGEKFFGAYGPKITAQLPYVVQALTNDPSTRQAGLTIWRESPPRTKDVPCTIALFFNLRDGLLNTHVFMRSSDVWLGLPYDAFNFTMVTCQVLKTLNAGQLPGMGYGLGTQYLTAVSSHIYEQHVDLAKQCLERVDRPEPLPNWFTEPEQDLLEVLDALRNSSKGDAIRWFED